MQQALLLARKAWEQGEVPVGAVVVDEAGQIVAEGYNQTIQAHDPSGHAEMLALRQAALRRANYRLPDLTVYVTLEPCMMCIGALLHARIKRVVFASADPKTGACGSVLDLASHPLNHQTIVQSGLLADEASALLRAFFKERRQLAKQRKTQRNLKLDEV